MLLSVKVILLSVSFSKEIRTMEEKVTCIFEDAVTNTKWTVSCPIRDTKYLGSYV